jgi:hypothetical protein
VNLSAEYSYALCFARELCVACFCCSGLVLVCILHFEFSFSHFGNLIKSDLSNYKCEISKSCGIGEIGEHFVVSGTRWRQLLGSQGCRQG